jgi:hypothetical protein
VAGIMLTPHHHPLTLHQALLTKHRSPFLQSISI